MFSVSINFIDLGRQFLSTTNILSVDYWLRKETEGSGEWKRPTLWAWDPS